MIVACLVPLEVMAMTLYMKALKVSEMSLSIPMLAFSPSFIVITGWLILGETVNLRGLAGIMTTVFGAYVLHMRATGTKGGLLAPFKSLATNKGARYMVMVAILYSMTSCLGKRAIQLSSPVFFAPFYFSLLGITFPFFYLIYSKETAMGYVKGIVHAKIIPKDVLFALVATGVLQAVMIYSHMIAISLANVAYMITVKRTSLLFNIVFGAVFLGERPIAPRLLGGGLMLFGVFLVMTTQGM